MTFSMSTYIFKILKMQLMPLKNFTLHNYRNKLKSTIREYMIILNKHGPHSVNKCDGVKREVRSQGNHQLLGGGKASWMHLSRTGEGVGTSNYLSPGWYQLVFMAFWWPLPIGGIYIDEVQGSPPQEVLLWHADYFQLKARKAKKTQKETLNFPLTI